jgi:putative transposase
MVERPEEYNWSSDKKNAMGKQIELIIPHESYSSLGKNDKEREAAYRLLFEESISDNKLQEIRDPINKAWVLGSK